MQRSAWMVLALLLCTLLLPGCGSPERSVPRDRTPDDPLVPREEAEGARILNDTCPVTGGVVDPRGETAPYKGHTVGFCSPGCIEKWNDMPEADKDAFVAKHAR